MKHTRHWLRAPGPVSPGMKIGLLGGSFNPAHEGHLHVSDVALKRLGLDYVWWLVAPQNPLKSSTGMAPLCDRLAYAADRFEQHPRVIVVDVESALGTRYTIDTLAAIQKRFSEVNFVWLMGTDNLMGFQRWKRWREIARRVPIAVVMRPGTTLAPLHSKAGQFFAAARARELANFARQKPPALAIIEGPRSSASATAIRAQTGWGEALFRAIPA
ncbi:MAG TPA: nicotinate-nucleotide adenylyltransferase [Rhizomicrobium sp.]|jgi:nicotinate-nucleotide adenylyltransferase